MHALSFHKERPLTCFLHDRSLVTDLRAAEKFEFSHLQSDAVKPLIDGAKFFYVEGYFLTHGTESVEYVAKKASEAGKVCVELSFYLLVSQSSHATLH